MEKDGEVDVSRIRANERIAWHNGRYVPESQVLIPFRDRGFIYGDAVFDTTRTFGHRLFKVREHVDRLYRSLRYLRIDPGLSPAEMGAITEEVLERNLHLLGPDDDYWVVAADQPRRRPRIDGEDAVQDGPTVIVECTPLPLRERARLYRDGIRVVVPAHPPHPARGADPARQDQQLPQHDRGRPGGRARSTPGPGRCCSTCSGNLAEGRGSNIFLVRDGELLTPRERCVLPGISRQTVIELAGSSGSRAARPTSTSTTPTPPTRPS